MNKDTKVVYPYNGISLSHRMEILVYTMTSLNLENIILIKKTDTKGHLLYDTIYMKSPE